MGLEGYNEVLGSRRRTSWHYEQADDGPSSFIVRDVDIGMEAGQMLNHERAGMAAGGAVRAEWAPFATLLRKCSGTVSNPNF